MAEDVWSMASRQRAQDGRTGSLTTLAAGTRVGKYEILDVLGQGGFGITYRARDRQLDRDVAVKEYLPSSFAVREPNSMVLPRSTHVAEDFRWGRERFLAEARTLARFEKASGIVNVYDFLEANGTAYMVMGLVTGETLEARLKRDGRLPQPVIERLLYPLLDGLEQVHAADFLHRDIKPANILIDEKGQPTLIDFGASRVALQGRTQVLTAVYTPGYAAFEQFTSTKQGPWTDIYALGATLHHCIAGAQPPNAIERQQEDTLVPAMQAGKGRYAPSLLGAIDAALKLKPAERPQSIAAWRRMLSGGSPETGRTGAAGRPEHGGRRRHWPLWLAAAVLVLCLGSGGGYVWWLDAQETEAWSRAATARTDAGYREYLAAWPAGRHAGEANKAIADLEARRLEELQRAEDDAWARARAANAIPALRAYLDRYPSGRYAADARSLIADIERAQQAAARRAEDEAWARARAANAIPALRAYLDRYPTGRYATDAHGLIFDIERTEQARRAEDEAWAAARAANTASSLRSYLERYPSGRFVSEARSMMAAIERREREPQPRDCPQCPEMVRVPPGSFMMGAAPGEHAREGVPASSARSELPQLNVTIRYAFSLGKYEVTRGEFAAFVDATRHQTGNACSSYGADGKWSEHQGRHWRNPGYPQTDRDPVVCVNWNDAMAYVEWLRRTTGKNYRLPSEAEWEYAARAGTSGARYWGDSRDGTCRYGNVADLTFAEKRNWSSRPEHIFVCADGHVYTAPVGRFQANAYGLHDMLGNVWEWAADCWNDTNVGAPANGAARTGGDCSARVVRGGAWGNVPWLTRAAYRNGLTSEERNDNLGFRVARTD